MTTEASACQAPRTLAPPIRGLWTSMDTGNDCKTHWSTENLEISFFQHRLVLFLCFHLVRCVELLLIRVGWIRIKVNSWKPHAGALSTVTHQWSPWGGLNTAQCFSYGANDQAQCQQAWRQIILEICLWDWRDKTCKPDDARWVRIPNFACGKIFIIWKSRIILTCCWRCSEICGEKKHQYPHQMYLLLSVTLNRVDTEARMYQENVIVKDENEQFIPVSGSVRKLTAKLICRKGLYTNS